MTDKKSLEPAFPLEPRPCFCIGPQNGEPFCPCEMRRRRIRVVNGRWVEPEHDHGIVRTAYKALLEKDDD